MGRRGKRHSANQTKTDRIWKVALYMRLSKDDGKADESDSITNQRKILMEYLEELAEPFVIVGEFVDDGISGTTDEERPEFMKMLAGIENGEINCVIVKALHRAFRNYADQGDFLERVCPTYNVRFISLGTPFIDSYTNPDSESNLEVPIHGLFNDRFAKTTSQEVRKTLNTKRRRGEFIGSFAPYGYSKHPDDKNRLIVDEEAADVVRLIFQFFLGGMSKRAIAKELNGRGIPCPLVYKQQKGSKHYVGAKADPVWTAYTVSQILTNQMYTGDMVQGKYTVKSYKVHKTVKVPKENWMIVPNIHEAIISREDFEAVQEMMKRDTRTAPGKAEPPLFSGYVFCADCGRAMHRKMAKGVAYLHCRRYTDTKLCTKHTVREDILYSLVLEAVQKQVAFVISTQEIIRQINEAPVRRQHSVRLDRQLSGIERELDTTRKVLDGLFVGLSVGDIDREQYLRLKAEHEEKKQRLTEAKNKVEKDRMAMADGIANNHPVFAHFIRYENIGELDKTVMAELINQIHVHEDKAIEIEFTHQDQFEMMRDYIENNSKALTVTQTA